METFNLQNIVNHGGIPISITGMLIVFSGLLIISFYIALLPRILNLFDKRFSRTAHPGQQSADENDSKTDSVEPSKESEPPESDANEIMSVIGLVLHLEQQRFMKLEGGDELITIRREQQQPSMWRTSGNMRKIPVRRQRA